MKRRLFTILSAVSLLLCVAVVVLWVRSHFRGDRLRYGMGGVYGARQRMITLESNQGTIDFRDTLYEPGKSPALDAETIGLHWETWRVSPEGDPLFLHKAWGKQWAGFGFVYQETGYPDNRNVWQRHRRELMVAGPHWSIVLPCALFPALVITLRLHGRRRRERTGLCPSCGYDLRATPGRCPECGLVPAAPPTTTTQEDVR